MEDLFIVNPMASEGDIWDGIYERVSKQKAIVVALMVDGGEDEILVSKKTLDNALWAIQGYAQEISSLADKLTGIERKPKDILSAA